MRNRPRIFASALSATERRAYGVVTLIFVGAFLATMWPLYTLFNRIRPLVFGKRENDNGVEYMVASESVALDILGFDLIRDVAPGEAVFISNDGELLMTLGIKGQAGTTEETFDRPADIDDLYIGVFSNGLLEAVKIGQTIWLKPSDIK